MGVVYHPYGGACPGTFLLEGIAYHIGRMVAIWRYLGVIYLLESQYLFGCQLRGIRNG